MSQLHGRETPTDVDDPTWSQRFRDPAGAAVPQRGVQVPTWLISTATLVVLAVMGITVYLTHSRPSEAASLDANPLYPAVEAAAPQTAPASTASAAVTPTPSPTRAPTSTQPKVPLTQAPTSFEGFTLATILPNEGAQAWRGLYRDAEGGQVWVSREANMTLQAKSENLREAAEYEAGFVCGLKRGRTCHVQRGSDVLVVSAYGATNDELAFVMASLLRSAA